MPKINKIVKVEEKIGGTNEVDILMNGGFNDALIVIGNKSVGLDEKKLHSIVRANFATIFQVSITMEEIIRRCNNVVSALKANEDKIIVEVEEYCFWFDGGTCTNEKAFPTGVPTEICGSTCNKCSFYTSQGVTYGQRET